MEGDLLVVAGSDQNKQVRLYGIDCPEKGQLFGDKARMLTSHLTNQKTVEITPIYKGPDGHENVLLRIEGTRDYLNGQLVAHGMAWVKLTECKADLCAAWKAIEELARLNAIGLWAEARPTPPWEWRKQQRLKIRNHQGLSMDSISPDSD